MDTFVCKEGSGCVPDTNSKTGYSCKKITSALSDNKNCSSDSNCNSDAFCDCNTIIGTSQCVPYPAARADTLDYYKKVLQYGSSSQLGKEFVNLIDSIYYPHKADYRCTVVPAPVEPSSSSSSSYENPSPRPTPPAGSGSGAEPESESRFRFRSETSASTSTFTSIEESDIESSSKGKASGCLNLKPLIAIFFAFVAFMF